MIPDSAHKIAHDLKPCRPPFFADLWMFLAYHLFLLPLRSVSLCSEVRGCRRSPHRNHGARNSRANPALVQMCERVCAEKETASASPSAKVDSTMWFAIPLSVIDLDRSRLRAFDALNVDHLRLLIELARHLHRLAFKRLGAIRIVQRVYRAG